MGAGCARAAGPQIEGHLRISPPPEQGAGDGDGNVRAAKPVGGCLLAPYMPERVDIESSARRTLGRGMAVWRIRRRSARRVAAQLVASTIVAAVAAVGLATTAAAQDGFADVSSRSHKANIEALRQGLFEGTECGEQQFCPNDPANRWTVAVWIVRALDGSDRPRRSPSRGSPMWTTTSGGRPTSSGWPI